MHERTRGQGRKGERRSEGARQGLQEGRSLGVVNRRMARGCRCAPRRVRMGMSKSGRRAPVEPPGSIFVMRSEPASGWKGALVAVSNTVDYVTQAGYVACTTMFFAVMLIGVFFRYVLNASLSWSDELALIVFTWAVFLSVASGYLHDRHVNLDLFMTRCSEEWRSRLSRIGEGLSGGYLLSLNVSGLLALPIVAKGHTDALGWPMSVPYLAIPVACLLMLLHWIRRNVVTSGIAGLPVKILIGASFFGIVYLPLGQIAAVEGTSRFVLMTGALFGPMLLGVPVAFCLGLMATLYVAVFGTLSFDTGAMQVFFGINILTLVAIPLLILSGIVMHSAGIAARIVDFALVLVGRVRGGLGASNVVASFIFGDISGSAVSDTAAIGSLMIPEMKRRGYRADFCAALQGAAGTLGMLAPISITVLLYSSAVNSSVSRLAAATIIPAFLVAFSFMAVVVVHARRHNYPREVVPLRLFLPRTLAAVPGLLAVVLVVGGILGGIFTPAEVGSILLMYVLCLSIFLYKTGQPRSLFRAAAEAGHISGMTLFMASTSAFLGFVLTRDLVSIKVIEFLSMLSTNRYFVLFVVTIVFIVLGMILEAPAMIFGFLPSFIPLLTQAGVDIIHWGVLFCINMGLGMIIPPVALNLFISTQIAGTRYEDAVRASVPFIIIMFVDLAIVAIIPEIPMYLPHVFFGHPLR